MLDKTDRILSYLPGTFRPAPGRSALRALANAFGSELQQGENSLAAVIASHWVKHADRGADRIDDLACLACLYGLAPREGESVEEFREHLYRYVNTFLDGTVTVQGILRISAEALGLHIFDDHSDLDFWSKRAEAEKELVTVEPRGDDACQLIFEAGSVKAAGTSATRAILVGNADLSGGVDLAASAILRIGIDNAAPVDVNIGEGQMGKKSLDQIAAAINARLPGAASHDGRHLIVASKMIGQASNLVIQDIENDAAEMVLGLAPRAYFGKAASSAVAVGAEDLALGIDLSDDRFLRLAIDGSRLAEIDCAGPDPAHTSLDQVCRSINGAFELPSPIATHDGHFLRLASPGKGSASSIILQRPAAQDATHRLFGDISTSVLGHDDLPARMAGKRDISAGLDLSRKSNIQLRIDGLKSVTINCAGSKPSNSRPSEIASKINAALGSNVAVQEGSFITLYSAATGPLGSILLETPPSGDATENIFGLLPRAYSGSSATSASISTLPWPSSGHDFRARHILKISVDGGSPVEIDLSAGAEEAGAVMLNERLVEAVKAAYSKIAVHMDGERLTLASASTGSASLLSIEPAESTRRRRFVTRAKVRDEAAMPIFGFIARDERGRAGSSACLKGEADLSRGVDLSRMSYLRISLDGGPAVDIDCAGKRPRATLITEVVDRINEALCQIHKDFSDVAEHDGHSLILTSPTVGAASRIALQPAMAEDAMQILLGMEPGMHSGKQATGIDFSSTADLSSGVDLEAGAAVKLGWDEEPPVEISLCGPNPSHRTLDEIVVAINVKLGWTLASHNGRHIALSLSPSPQGIKIRKLIFAAPGGPDATKAVFGFKPPRRYQSTAASPARITGTKDLGHGVDLSKARYLHLSIDGSPAQAVDCAAKASDPKSVRLADIEEAINAVFQNAASHDESNHLVLQSGRTGQMGGVAVEKYSSGDARQLLFGGVEYSASGSDPAPAAITGMTALMKPADLSRRSILRLTVNGGRPIDIDVAGSSPESTAPDEIIESINKTYPGLASATEDFRLRLTAPTSGELSSISLQPVRYLELQEYPPHAESFPPDEDGMPPKKKKEVKHGDAWSIENKGANDVFVEAKITAPSGAAGPTLINGAQGWQIRMLKTLHAGKTLHLWRDADLGLMAEICALDAEGRRMGDPQPVASEDILVGPIGGQASVPFQGIRHITGGGAEPIGLQLNNPRSPKVIRLLALSAAGGEIEVEVKESDPAAIIRSDAGKEGVLPLRGRIRATEGGYRLVDGIENIITALREGPEVDLEAHRDCVVSVIGSLFSGQPNLLIASRVDRVFHVLLRLKGEGGRLIEESYSAATIGSSLKAVDLNDTDSLLWQVNSGPSSSRLVYAEEIDKVEVLRLPMGRSEWRYTDCHSSRFNQARFSDPDRSIHDRFAGLQCDDCRCCEYGIFNASRFSSRRDLISAIFAPEGTLRDPAVQVAFAWESHMPGSFIVNLPADLPERFGGRFNQARFSQSESKPELYEKAVTEPDDDRLCIINLINSGLADPNVPIAASRLVKAERAGFPRLGWKTVKIPSRKPQHLTLGGVDMPAKIYLQEEGAEGFIMLAARENGAWGNEISVSVRQAGPAMYDFAITYRGARFENARQAALGLSPHSPSASCKKGGISNKPQESPSGSLPALMREILKPGSVGVLQAKAAGIHAEVSRDST